VAGADRLSAERHSENSRDARRRRAEKRIKRLLNLLPPLAFAGALLLIWHVATDLRLVSPVFLPTPARAFSDLAARFADGTIWEPLGATVQRMTFGWFLASLAGVALGAAIGLTPLARDLLEPTLEFVRPLPASAMIPVAILFFGLSENMAVSVIAFGFDSETQFDTFKKFVRLDGFDPDNFDFTDDALIERFARLYNGPGDVANYSAKMKAA
jgi:ABC-type anion transport system duplicated permease subunit